MKHINHFAGLLAASSAVLLAASAIPNAEAQSLVEQAARDEIAYMSREEPAMREAFGKARANLDTFLRAAAKPAPGTSDYALKVAVSDGSATEYFWVGDIKPTGDKFSAVLSNEPRLVKKYKNGERFTFTRDLIVDWTYINASMGRMFGNYTACALLTKESPAEAAKFKAQYGLKCE